MADRRVIRPGTDNSITINNLREESSGEYANDAVVTMSLFRMDDVAVTNAGNPITLTYVPSSNGIYRGVIPAAADIVDGRRYKVNISAVSPSKGDVALTMIVVCKSLTA